MKGVSPNIMFGQIPNVGTNSFDVLIDEDALIEGSINSDNIEIETYQDMEDIQVEDMITNLYEENESDLEINETDFEFGFGLENIELSEHKISKNNFIDGFIQKNLTSKQKIKIKKNQTINKNKIVKVINQESEEELETGSESESEVETETGSESESGEETNV
jgi:hypothetical protein